MTLVAALTRAYRRCLAQVHDFRVAIGLLTAVCLLIGSITLALFGWLGAVVTEGNSNVLDTGLMIMIAGLRRPGLTSIMKVLSFIGSGYFAIPFTLAVAFYLRRLGRGFAARIYLLATLSGWALNGLTKWLTHRARPQIIPRLSHAGWYSFPSGHAMLAVLVFGMAALLLGREIQKRWLRSILWAGAALLVGGIAFSRVYLGVHYPSDVTGALLAGTGWSAVWAVIARMSSRPASAGGPQAAVGLSGDQTSKRETD